MVRRMVMLGLVAAYMFSSACATVQFIDPTKKDEKNVGLKFYLSKPYLLVSRTGAKDNPIKVEVVYLPDQEHPQYARFRAGLGSTVLSAKLTNSILTEYGQTSDSKVPETLTAIGSLAGSLAGAFKTTQEGINLRQETADRAQLDVASTVVSGVATDLEAARNQATAASVLTPTHDMDVRNLVSDLNIQAAALRAPGAIASEEQDRIATALAQDSKSLDDLKIANPASGDTAPNRWNSSIADFQSRLNKIVDQLRPEKAPDATFELYAIEQSGGKTTLVRIDLPKQ